MKDVVACDKPRGVCKLTLIRGFPNGGTRRGYAFVQNSSGTIISSSSQLKSNDEVKLTFGAGTADAVISKTNK